MNTRKTKPNYLKNLEETLIQTKTTQYRELAQAYAEILKPSTSTHRVFIACTLALKQYNLDHIYDPAFILNEAYIRAWNALDNGKTIVNYHGWVQLTSRHIIQELSREVKKNALNQQVFPETVAAPDQNDYSDQEAMTPELLHMRKAFAQLSQLEQEILYLKVVRGMRWKNIQHELVTGGYPLTSTNTLSQKKRRALKHLEESYRAIAS